MVPDKARLCCWLIVRGLLVVPSLARPRLISESTHIDMSFLEAFTNPTAK
jgi:hypothetical protein